MRSLIFLSKVAFLSGIAMVLAFSLALFNWNRDEVISSSIVLAGYGLSVLLLPVVNLVYLVLWIAGRIQALRAPKWLLLSNIVFLFLLVLYLFYLNDPFYHKG